jgi:hypothetical protein
LSLLSDAGNAVSQTPTREHDMTRIDTIAKISAIFSNPNGFTVVDAQRGFPMSIHQTREEAEESRSYAQERRSHRIIVVANADLLANGTESLVALLPAAF